MTNPFNNRLRKRFEALRSQKEKEEKENKEKIPVNPEDSKTKEDTIVNYRITDNPESETEKTVNREEKVENRTNLDGQIVSNREVAAKSKHTSPEEFVVFGKDWQVRRMFAINPATSRKMLVLLAADEKWVVRSGVAHNPNTPPETLATLAEDKDERVRFSAAGNTATPLPTLVLLTIDGDRETRIRAIRTLDIVKVKMES